MATRAVVPRGDGEGSVGTSAKRWGDVRTKQLNGVDAAPMAGRSNTVMIKRSTLYAAGVTGTVPGLPIDWILICTTSGTTAATDITLPVTLVDGATITDGEAGTAVTWTLRKVVTQGSLGYRQPSKAYSAGDLAYSESLPTGWCLSCSTAGTTGSGALTIATPALNDTVSDGTVVWTIRTIGNDATPLGAIIPYTGSTNPSGYLECNGAAVSRTMYPDLFALIGTQYGAGDGSTTFNLPTLTDASLNDSYSKTTVTTTGAGTFTPTQDGWYRITLQGAGGGGGGATATSFGNRGGGGGGGGAKIVAYEKLTAGTTYSYTIGAGGAGGNGGVAGSNGGNTTLVVNNNNYNAGGGLGGNSNNEASAGGFSGDGKINDVIVSKGMAGANGGTTSASGTALALGGAGGGLSTRASRPTGVYDGMFGSGGTGGVYNSTAYAGGAGGDGYITFEHIGTPMRQLIKAFHGQTADSALIDITQYAQELANKVNPTFDNITTHKVTYTSSGTYTAPVSGTYRITLQGGGGGGGGAGTHNVKVSGGGGGSGAKLEFYERLTSGTTYSYVIGAGGTGGAAGSASSESNNGSNGGDSSITINSNAYVAGGGGGGGGSYMVGASGLGGAGKINNVTITYGAPGGAGTVYVGQAVNGGNGGGAGGGIGYYINYSALGSEGGGGSGGGYASSFSAGGDGAVGYISFEYCSTT